MNDLQTAPEIDSMPIFDDVEFALNLALEDLFDTREEAAANHFSGRAA